MKTIDIKEIDLSAMLPVATSEKDGLMGKELVVRSFYVKSKGTWVKFCTADNVRTDFLIFCAEASTGNPDMYAFSAIRHSSSSSPYGSLRRILGTNNFFTMYAQNNEAGKSYYLKTNEFYQQFEILPIGTTIHLQIHCETVDAPDESTLVEIPIS